MRVSVVKQADVPTAPVSPRTKLNIALGLLVGLAVGVGAPSCASRSTRR